MLHGISAGFSPQAQFARNIHQRQLAPRPNEIAESRSHAGTRAVPAARELNNGPRSISSGRYGDSSARYELSVRAKTHLRSSDDGSSLSVKAKLQFQYEFESADGLQVQIKAKARIQVSSNNDGESLHVKQRIQFQATLIQQSVTEGTAPLAGSESLSDGQSSAVLGGLEGFLGLVNELTDQFLNLGETSGDELIAGIVEGFNSLIEAFASLFNPSAPEEGEPSAVLAGDPTAALFVEALDPAVSGSIESAVVPEEPLTEAVAEADPPLEPSVTGAEPTEPETVGEETPVEGVRSFLVNLRIRFTQSLTGLVQAFDESEQTVATQLQRLDVHARFRLDVSEPDDAPRVEQHA